MKLTHLKICCWKRQIKIFLALAIKSPYFVSVHLRSVIYCINFIPVRILGVIKAGVSLEN